MTEPRRTNIERIELAAGAYVLRAAGFVVHAEADSMLEQLLRETPWKQGEIVLFGKRVREPRLSAWYGDAPYEYSGRTVTPVAWTPLLLDLKARVEAAASAAFNSVLLNRYRSGADSMGLHADDETELGRNPVIASLSFGQARRFTLQPRPKTKEIHPAATSVSFELGHGDLLVMAGTCQHHYRHGVPKQPGIRAERVNLTFRFVHSHPR